jgi:hypothetical protein
MDLDKGGSMIKAGSHWCDQPRGFSKGPGFDWTIAALKALQKAVRANPQGLPAEGLADEILPAERISTVSSLHGCGCNERLGFNLCMKSDRFQRCPIPVHDVLKTKAHVEAEFTRGSSDHQRHS